MLHMGSSWPLGASCAKAAAGVTFGIFSDVLTELSSPLSLWSL